jgi:TonB family protein
LDAHWHETYRTLIRLARLAKYGARRILARRGRERLIAVAAVVVLHLALLAAVIWGWRSATRPPARRDMPEVLYLQRQQPRPVQIEIPDVALSVVAPPEIVIQNDEPTQPIATASAAIVLPPHPDPVHPNEQPVTPTAGTTPVVVLRILVMPNGAVTDAKVVPPASQNPAADEAALAWVKSHWHFMPAMVGDVAIQYWTTVSVRFTAQ